MKRRIVVFFVALLAFGLCGALVWFNFFRDRMIAQVFATMQPPAQTVSAVPVQTRTWTPGIPAIGTARAENGVELATQIGGVVRSISIVPNKRFGQGDVLVQLDDSVERAELPDASASLKLAEANLERSNSLQSRGFTPQASNEQAQATLAAARSRLARLQAVIEQKAIAAPFQGVAGISRVNVGQFIQPGTVVTTFQDLRSMKVDFQVPEQYADKLKVGQSVRVGPSADQLTVQGRLNGIDPRVDPQTRLIAVQAIISENADETILPGQFLQVRVELDPEPNVMVVPQTSVVSSLYGDYVFVIEDEVKDDKPRKVVKQVFVNVGRRDGALAEIVSGVKPGQMLVASGQNKIQAGAVVAINNAIDITKLASGQSH